MNQSPLVSIIIPTYNAELCIERSLGSALRQTYQHIEIICVDNGSADGTWNLLQKIKDEHPQIVLLKEEKQGACWARNKGLKESNGDWIQFLDADDLIKDNKIEHQMNLVSENAQTANYFIAGNEHWIKTDGTAVEFHQFSKQPWRDLVEGTLGDTCSNLWNKKQLQKINGWNTELKSSQELDLMFRLLKNDSKVVYDSAILTKVFQQSEGSISKKSPIANIARANELRLEVKKHLNLTLKTNEYDPVINRTIFNNLIVAWQTDQQACNELIEKAKSKGFSLRNVGGMNTMAKWYGVLFGIKALLSKYPKEEN